MARIVVIGGSFGGLTAAFELRRLLGRKAVITLISDLDRFVFIPSLPWVAMGWRSEKDITFPLKPVLEARGIRFVHDRATGVDADSSKVLTSKEEFQYDYLIIATGPHLAFDEVPGLGPERGHTECIFTLEQAERTRLAWERFLESPGPIAIGSVQGVSCLGPPYEFAFEVDHELRKRRLRRRVPIVFVTSEPYIGHFGIGGFGRSRRWIEDEFASKDITPVTSQEVAEFAPGEVRLKDGAVIPFRLGMFAPAMKGVPAVSHLGNARGFLPVDARMRHKDYRNVFAVGVAIAIAPIEKTPVPTGVPKTGYMAVRMGLTAAHTIASEVLGSAPPKPYEMDVICLMDMGGTAALMSARPILPPRDSTVLRKAVWARWLKAWLEKYVMFKMKRGLSNWP